MIFHRLMSLLSREANAAENRRNPPAKKADEESSALS
jgi:hypothetical protein